jgi:hypothetical protein
VGSSQLDADALDLLALAAIVVSDRETWTRDYRAALRWKRSNRKPLHMEPEHHPREEYRTISSSPRDDRATAWSLVGALELVADFPDGPEVIRAIDLYMLAARGWSPSRVEECGHAWMLWTLALTLARKPGLTLAPRTPERQPEVDLKARRRGAKDDAPPTERSSGLRASAAVAA